jgi:hypothetical protein
MAYSERQNNLFAAEDWKVAYKAFSNIDFTSYDFDTMRLSMVNYIRQNFPENFNDYIESSEFIAIIELLAYLSQSLAFRMDLNSRENFLETAERRDSVFKLARMLGYNPRRNVPASGLMKITGLRTNEPLTDSLNRNLANKTVFWDDVNNPESYEQFITILNSTFSNTNRFSYPIKSGKISNIKTELYRITKQIGTTNAISMPLTINGVQRNFEAVDGDFNDGEFFFERHPDPLNDMGVFYRNDGKGLNSGNTGFFMLFKQGNLSFTDLNFTTPIANRVADINLTNINETDLYVQELTENGGVLNKWTRIPNTVGQTLNFNSQALGSRNLFATENLNNDGVRIKFPDGNFGNIPVGSFRVWHRASSGDRYSIQPENARNIPIEIPYENKNGGKYILTVILSLQTSVNNSLPTETLASIKSKAPQTYYTQNRMVSAQDYNIFPFSQSSNIKKLRAVNKTHAGHSRYIDINDPTGTFQNIELFADDGYIYKQKKDTSSSVIVSANNTANNIIKNTIPDLLRQQNVNNFIYDSARRAWIDYKNVSFNLETLDIKWKPLPVSSEGSTGYMTETTSVSAAGSEQVLTNVYETFKQIQENNFIKFVNPSDPADYKWVRITKETNAGLLTSGLSTSVGPWTLSEDVPLNWTAHEVIVTLRKEFDSAEISSIQQQIEDKKTFGIGYMLTNKSTSLLADKWYVIENENLDKTSPYNVSNAGSTTGSPIDASWVILFNYVPIDDNSYKYDVSIRGEQYILQSAKDIKFYNIKNIKVVDSNNKANTDKITITTFNDKPGSSEVFRWYDSTGNGIGDSWYSEETASTTTPNGFEINLPLRTRNQKWYDVEFNWVSNFGILKSEGESNVSVITAENEFVHEAVVPINTYFDNGDAAALTPNVTIANNLGRVNRVPSNVNVSFNNATFGFNILDGSGNVHYKQLNSGTGVVEFYQANNSGATKSFGTDGATYNASADGHLILTSSNTSTQSGTFLYEDLDNNNHLLAQDSTAVTSTDKIRLDYVNYKERLDTNIDWHIVDTVIEDDGYTDRSKVVVAPFDTDNDLIPDRPLQFYEFVDTDDLVYLEKYLDFDGYSYDVPSSGKILDYRKETSVNLDIGSDTISPTSYSAPVDISGNDIAWISIVSKSILENDLENDSGKLSGTKVYVESEDKVYLLTPNSTNTLQIRGVVTTDYSVRNGRGETQNTLLPVKNAMIFKWNHVADKNVRIDPSISNVVEFLVLTETYNDQVQRYLNVPGTAFPLPPTSNDLALEFADLNQFKTASDILVYKSGKFKLLFGNDASPELRAKFRVVKLNERFSDNEIKTRIIRAFNRYFDPTNWNFGETFYFTELSSFIHSQLGNSIGSIVILPKNTNGKFGDLFSVKAESDEIFLSTASVSDIEVVSKITEQTLKTR